MSLYIRYHFFENRKKLRIMMPEVVGISRATIPIHILGGLRTVSIGRVLISFPLYNVN